MPALPPNTPGSPPPAILHLAAGCWACGGGLSEALAQLTRAQARLGAETALLFLADHPKHPLLKACRQAGVRVTALPHRARTPFFVSLRLPFALPKRLRTARFLHLHGFWSFPIVWGAFAACRCRLPYAVSPHGALCAQAPLPLRKRLFWKLFGRTLLRRAAWLHAASPLEADALRRALGEACPPIRLVTNGVDGEALDLSPPPPRTRTFLFLGRKHPQKGIDLLVEAWQRTGLAAEGWSLRLIGPEDGARVPARPGLSDEPPLFGKAKAQALRSAACLVLPSHSENFGIAVAEALWCRTPAIATTGTPWASLGSFCVPPTPEALAEAMRRLADLSPAAREAAFAEAFAHARAAFQWEPIARALLP